MFPEQDSSCMLIGKLLFGSDCLNSDKKWSSQPQIEIEVCPSPPQYAHSKKAFQKNYRVGRSPARFQALLLARTLKEPTLMWFITTLYPVRRSCFFSGLHPSAAMWDLAGGARGSFRWQIWADFKWKMGKAICNLSYHGREQDYKK